MRGKGKGLRGVEKGTQEVFRKGKGVDLLHGIVPVDRTVKDCEPFGGDCLGHC